MANNCLLTFHIRKMKIQITTKFNFIITKMTTVSRKKPPEQERI